MTRKIPRNLSIRSTLKRREEIINKETVPPPDTTVPNCGIITHKDRRLAEIAEGGWENPVYKIIHDGFNA